MRNISICELSVRRSGEFSGSPLPFRVKIEVAKLLSRLGVSAIETSPVPDGGTDYFLVKSLASAVGECTLSVPVDILDPESPARTWNALKDALKPRLQVAVPVSTVQMEYFCHKKPAALLKMISDCVSACSALCPDVEFVAEDFSRSEPDFLKEAISAAVAAGARMVTVSDAAGTFLPDEFYVAVSDIRAMLPEDVRLGVQCSNELFLADACAVAAVRAGADEVKTMAFGNSTTSLKRFPRILNACSDRCGAVCGVGLTGLEHCLSQINSLCDVRSGHLHVQAAPAEGDGAELKLSARDDVATVLKVAGKLGYELSEEDSRKVFDVLSRMPSKDEIIGAKEIDAIVASVAFQVPSTYHLESFVINTGNVLTPTCSLRLRKGDDILESVSTGDGPVDAAFQAIGKVTGRNYELDDFQIRAVTEGRQAMGETVVRLRHGGSVYSGRGVSKDIVGSSVLAYLNAVNKIAYEEEQA